MTFIDEQKIQNTIETTAVPKSNTVKEILNKALNLKGLDFQEIAQLLKIENETDLQALFNTAYQVKNLIYGNRVVFFAPLYISNLCKNNCLYCAFRSNNKVPRKALSMAEITKETQALLKDGHKRVLLVAGESYPEQEGLDYVIQGVKAVYDARYKNHNIRRVNVNIAPLEIEDFKKLKSANIGTYQLFQETYHPATYTKMHPSGPKSDYLYRLETMDRALKSGIDDIGIGLLFGLYDYQFEVLALISHIKHLEKEFGLGPHTISVPRIEPATGTDIPETSIYKVNDTNFKKIVAILRLAVPYTGIILSTREYPQIRRDLLSLGVSQISAGSKTNPGGYDAKENATEQFSLGDTRSLDEVIADLLQMDFIPSFCTACYRLGRTGLDFMEYAKPGDIKKKCEPNAILTFAEYLQDFASPEVATLGKTKIKEYLDQAEPKIKSFLETSLNKIYLGKRDLFI